MYTALTYVVSLIVIVVSVFVTLFIKNELEKIFREKDVAAFHICNVVIILMVSVTAHAVMTIYIIENGFNLFLQLVIHLFMIIPIYFLGHQAFEKYNTVYQKYTLAENRKVIILNEKYVKKKKRFSKLKNYNAIFKEQ